MELKYIDGFTYGIPEEWKENITQFNARVDFFWEIITRFSPFTTYQKSKEYPPKNGLEKSSFHRDYRLAPSIITKQVYVLTKITNKLLIRINIASTIALLQSLYGTSRKAL